jgi:nucleoside-diphosphate-sugar epimerase
VRDASREDRTAHLLAMNGRGVGKVELAEADLLDDGAYDDIFRGCSAVFHVAANFGTDPRWAAATSVIGRLSPVDEVVAKDKEEPTTSYDQGVYDSLVVATERVLASIEKSGGSVKRLIYTSSYAAIGGPGSYADGHQISELTGRARGRISPKSI